MLSLEWATSLCEGDQLPPAAPTRARSRSYHKLRGDYVRFVKGNDPECRRRQWDRIYVSTLFTFYWKAVVETIRYYAVSVGSSRDIFVGGVMATLLGEEIERETGTTVIRGLIDKPGMLDSGDKRIVDRMVPDYSILDEADYDYGLRDAYLAYATRGCPNDCPFCAVSILEPSFVHYLPLRRQVRAIEETFGPKHDLILLDNNVLASDRFEQIIEDILDLGFHKGAKKSGRLRTVDFNQGIDLRLLTPQKMAALAGTAIRPVRLAFDNVALKDLYVSRIKMARDAGIHTLSNYVLYNYLDTPEDFYERIRLNVLLNRDLGMQIYSFPMKYIPLDAKDRSYVGPRWNRRLLRGIQCVLLATKGMVGPKLDFFEAAFGTDHDEFVEIAMMPDDYIIHRERYKNNGAADWRQGFRALSRGQRAEFVETLNKRDAVTSIEFLRISPPVKELLSHYGTTTRRPARQIALEIEGQDRVSSRG